MSLDDWSDLTTALVEGAGFVRGVSGGFGAPPSGGAFVHAARALISGAWGRHTNQVDFAPTAGGVSVRGVVRRLGAGVAPFLFGALRDTSVDAAAYLLGLADGSPARIALVKGPLANGVADVAPGTLGVLRRSEGTIDNGAWVHLRLDVVPNANGDVVLSVYRNDLAAHPFGSEVWEPIGGMDQLVDDRLETATGSTPLGVTYDGGGNLDAVGGGYAGFGARHAGSGVACHDGLQVVRQT
jgi:hypothetical protein